MSDPQGLLQGEGITRQVRWLTYTAPEQIAREPVIALVREGARVAALTRGERLATALDREDARPDHDPGPARRRCRDRDRPGRVPPGRLPAGDPRHGPQAATADLPDRPGRGRGRPARLAVDRLLAARRAPHPQLRLDRAGAEAHPPGLRERHAAWQTPTDSSTAPRSGSASSATSRSSRRSTSTRRSLSTSSAARRTSRSCRRARDGRWPKPGSSRSTRPRFPRDLDVELVVRVNETIERSGRDDLDDPHHLRRPGQLPVPRGHHRAGTGSRPGRHVACPTTTSVDADNGVVMEPAFALARTTTKSRSRGRARGQGRRSSTSRRRRSATPPPNGRSRSSAGRSNGSRPASA